MGILSQVLILLALIKFYGRPKKEVSVKFFCNSKAALRRVKAVICGRGLKLYLAAEYDLTAEIQSTMKTLEGHGVMIGFGWVHGHQDEDKVEEELDRESLLNIDCDVQAGMFRESLPLGLSTVRAHQDTLLTPRLS